MFKEPDLFDPDRFAAPREEHKTPYAYLGFGGGMHQCMGQQFGYLQVSVTTNQPTNPPPNQPIIHHSTTRHTTLPTHQTHTDQPPHLQVKTILATILSKYEIEMLGPLPEPDYTAMVVGPKGKPMCRYKRRKN